MSIEIQKSHIREWIWTILSIVYIFSPLDILPDVPVVGWLDDFFIVATAVLNLIQGYIQGYTEDNNQSLSRLLRIFKWVLIVLGVIGIVLVLLLGALIVKLLSS